MKQKKIRIRFYPRELLFAGLIMLLPVSLVLELRLGISGTGYIDEFLGIVATAYIVLIGVMRGMSRKDAVIIAMTFICVILGLIGNFKERLITNWFPVAVDVLCLLKVVMPYLVMKMVGQLDRDMNIIRYMLPFAKLLVIVSTLCGIINQFHYIRMSYGTRYGLRAYFFLFNNAARLGYIIACCMLVIILQEKSKIKEILYIGLCVFNMILTTKGVVYIVLVCFAVFMLLWRGKEKLTPAQVVPLAIAGTVASTVQINSYIKDYNSPRIRLIRYGAVTANDYFPFGSGFATYGSDMAARNYSVLYYRYRFHKLYGLSPTDGSFLNDCYLAMVIGQFGYIGLIAYIILLGVIFLQVNSITLMKPAKAMTLSIYIGLIVSCFGTAIIKSSIGVMIMAMLGLMVGYSSLDYHKEYEGTNLSIHF